METPRPVIIATLEGIVVQSPQHQPELDCMFIEGETSVSVEPASFRTKISHTVSLGEDPGVKINDCIRSGLYIIKNRKDLTTRGEGL